MSPHFNLEPGLLGYVLGVKPEKSAFLLPFATRTNKQKQGLNLYLCFGQQTISPWNTMDTILIAYGLLRSTKIKLLVVCWSQDGPYLQFLKQ